MEGSGPTWPAPRPARTGWPGDGSEAAEASGLAAAGPAGPWSRRRVDRLVPGVGPPSPATGYPLRTVSSDAFSEEKIFFMWCLV